MFWEGATLSAHGAVPILPGMGADLVWCEDVAHHLLEDMGAASADRVTVDDVAAYYGMRMSARAPAGCEGAVGDTLRVPAKGRPENRARKSGHEVGHVATWLCHPTLAPHPEPAMGLVGLLVEIPKASAISAVRECGFDPEALSARFPGLWLSDVLTRCALATGGLAVLVRARSEAQWVANDVDRDEAFLFELRVRALVASARQREGYVEAGEWAAAPIHEPGCRGIMVVRR